MLDLASLPTELLTLFQSEAREAFYELRSAVRTTDPHRQLRVREILYLLRGNAEALGIRPWVEQIRAAHKRLLEPGAEADAVVLALEDAIVGSFKDAGWEARREKINGMPQIYLYPGYVYVSAQPCLASTILGSCVSVCLWDESRRVGGMNHFLLPGGPETPLVPKYAHGAMAALLDQFLAQGGTRGGVKAKIFGGARLVAGHSDVKVPLGTANAERAEHWLAAQGIQVVERHVGGAQGRKLAFDMKSGATRISLV